jgi:uncharacterized alkaline shock family protein YloU
MSTAAAPEAAPRQQTPPVPAPRTEVPAATRGRTHIPDRVLAKVARQAVRELPDTQRLPGHLGGLIDRGSAKATVRQAGSQATVHLEIALAYPAPVRTTAQRVREHVRRRVQGCTGFTVRHIDITVTELEPARRAQ